jgi:hypothetical protein
MLTEGTNKSPDAAGSNGSHRNGTGIINGFSWKSFGKANLVFAKKRAGLIYSLICFLIVAIAFIWGIKTNEHITDREYVKQHIEKSDPLEQIAIINKLIRNEEFDIDRDLLTKSIHVKPHTTDDPVASLNFTEIGSSYGFKEGDSVLYLFKNKWLREKITVTQLEPNDAYNHDPFSYNIKIEFDPSAILLNFDYSRLEYWDNSDQSPYVRKFAPDLLSTLGGNDGRNPVFFTESELVGIYDDTVHTMKTYAELPKGDSKDGILDSPLPKGTVGFKPAGHGIAFLANRKGNYSLYYKEDKIMIKPIPDSLLNVVTGKGETLDWSYKDDLFACYTSDYRIGIVTKSSNWQLKYLVNNDIFFVEMPQVLTRKKNIVWLAGRTTDGYGVAKVTMNEKNDTLYIKPLPAYETEYFDEPAINVNQDGLVISDLSKGTNLNDLQLYRFSNLDNTLNPFKMDSILDHSVVDDLSRFEIHIPKYSSSFEFTATSNLGAGVSYQVIPGKDKAKPEINIIQDNKAENPQPIFWPDRKIFDVDTQYDYFFTVILIIGFIIIYFFGLFYVLDYKNRDKPYEAEKLPLIDKLPTLREKLEYTKNTMGSLKLRSEVMLWLGIVIGVAGMFAFVYSLKTFFQDSRSLQFSAEFTVRMLRTFAIFSFMEIFSFYFLKQYRIIFNEYKRFFSLYLRLMNYYQYLELVETYPDNPKISYKDMRDAILKDFVNMHDESTLGSINEFEKTVASDIVKTLADKIPNGKS